MLTWLFPRVFARSVRLRLLCALVCVSVLWIGITVLLSYLESKHRVEAELEVLFGREFELLEAALEQHTTSVRALSSSVSLALRPHNLFEPEGAQALRSLIAHLPESLRLNYMAVLRPDGHVLTASSRSGDYAAALSENAFEHLSAAPLAAAEPVFMEPGVEPFAVLKAAQNSPQMSQWALVPVRDAGEHRGWLLLSSDWLGSVKQLFERARASMAAMELDVAAIALHSASGERLVSSPPGIDTAPSPKVFQRSVSLSPALHGMQLSMAIDESLPRKRVLHSVVYSLVIASVTLLMMVLLFNTVFQRLVLQRLERLQRVAEEMVEPENMRQIQSLYDDEIGALEQSFNQMSVRLQQSYVCLEDTVAQRTQALAAVVSQLEQFNYIASHDLREPIRTVQTYCQLLRIDLPGLPQCADTDLSFIESATARMGELIDDLLLYSRNRHRSIEPQRLSMQTIMQEVCADHQALISRSGTRLSYVELHEVFADRDQLRQVLVNLLTNAIKFSGEAQAPLIRLSSTLDGDWVELCFSDHGIGIALEFHRSVFEPFKRLHSNERVQGTGIGLAVVAESIRRHGGRIELHSTPGRGSTFVLRWPRNQAALDAGLQAQRCEPSGERKCARVA